jgi:integrase
MLQNPTSQFGWLIVFTLETGMRRGDIVNLEWEHYFPEKRLV